MKFIVFTLLMLVFICSFTSEAAYYRRSRCPSSKTGTCAIKCLRDTSCPGHKICCHNGCGYSCVSPTH
ncbi:hypothetical protein EB796_008282 [Bugula neritina]|uniref:WAP domain-containing protein n=1 Tax=Bugula neritina TaxID=10212 RepID=A0A7J7K666_BUGNE|nr:hypothetical protein EB796_008282 [Bugula neritina]